MKVTEKTILESLRSFTYEIDLHCHDYKLAVEIDEKDYQDRDISR